MSISMIRPFAAAALALATALAAGAAQARNNVDVQWSVSIGGPIGVSVYSPGVPVYAPAPVYAAPLPVVVPRPVYHPAAYGDRDRDGIPNRYDRRYNPGWDRDGDGIPNRYDRRPGQAGRGASHGPVAHNNDRDRDGVPNWRDRDGVSNGRDRNDGNPRRGDRD